MKQHILFLTGKLAEPALNRVLHAMEPLEFDYTVKNLGLSVAALMTAGMVDRRLADAGPANRIIVPGLCAGDLSGPAARLGIPIERGPKDLKDIPGFFGRQGRDTDLSRYDIRIFAEIVEAPRLDVTAIVRAAHAYRADGADVIDIGCLPGQPFDHLEASVQALKAEGFTVSVDSLEAGELLRGAKAGADYLLSLKESSLHLLDKVDSIPVLIPEAPGDMESLYRAMDRILAMGRPFIADSILDPIHFGFTDAVVRYRDLRHRYPQVEIMMGTGNLSELTDADTVGMNALMLGIMSELNIRNLLATQVSAHARSVVRELDAGRRIMFAAREDNALPRGYDARLLVVHDKQPFPYSVTELRELRAAIKDPSYRVHVSAQGVHVFNRDGFWTANGPYELFPLLHDLADDAPHAFYMGVELAKAQIAWTLGKRYEQDAELDWQSAAVQGPNGPENSVHQYKAQGATLEARARLPNANNDS